MSDHERGPREEQALREVGVTAVRGPVQGLLVAVFLLGIASVWVADTVRHGASAFGVFAPSVVLAAARSGDVFAANRVVLAQLAGFERDLEEDSLVARWVRPWAQWALTAGAGVGNEKAYLGRDGWLFYRPDIDYVAGPGFLEPRVLTARARGGKSWLEPPLPDPLPAIVDFKRQLDARGIRLIVLTAPLKPMLAGERFSRFLTAGSAPLQNASFGSFRDLLDAAGVELLDPTALLAEPGSDMPEAFLASDTHWSPGAVERVARALARRIRPEGVPAGECYFEDEFAVEGTGDIVALLGLPPGRSPYPPERVRVARVSRSDAAACVTAPPARVLLLGDSFSNIYALSALGFGEGAGLAERLSFALGEPVERLARNDGGAVATREALAAEALRGRDRLRGKTVVVWEFAMRELAQGVWRRVEVVPPP